MSIQNNSKHTLEIHGDIDTWLDPKELFEFSGRMTVICNNTIVAMFDEEWDIHTKKYELEVDDFALTVY